MAKKKRSAKKSTAKKRSAPRKKGGAPKKAGGSSLAGLARKIVRMTQNPSFGEAEIRALYNPDCTSHEARATSTAAMRGSRRRASGGRRCSRAPPGMP